MVYVMFPFKFIGLQCYYCEGQDNDPCVTNPDSIYRRITCPRNEYCNVVRRELILQPQSKISLL